MPLPGSLIERLCEHLSKHRGTHVDAERELPIGGGSINDCYRLDTNEGRFFVKVNSADRFPSMFDAEADGLGQVAATSTVRVPAVIATGEDHDDSYILMEHIDSGLKTANFWETFGRELAALHRNTSTAFGLDRSNYVGSLIQVNSKHARWDDFFIRCRLEPQVKMARDRQRIGDGEVLRFERLYQLLHSFFPVEAPALLHGDLWSGNFMCDDAGRPVLIDPAVYFGHREMDIAMTRLFGGFDEAFYTSYNNAWPLGSGWEERMDLCDLYPLLVHVNLFGGGYAQQVAAILRRFA